MKHKLESRFLGEISTTSDMKVKEESEKAGLKLNIQKTEIMASSTITSWQIEGGKVETVTDFIFLGSKITATVTAVMKLKDICFLDGKL